MGGNIITFETPGSRITTPVASVLITQYDTCLGLFNLVAQGSTSERAYDIDGLLNSATLMATVPMLDLTRGKAITVTVELTWTGTGKLSHETTTSHEGGRGFVLNALTVGASRPAQATGTVSDGTTNFTPTPSTDGQNEHIMNGMVAVEVVPPTP